MSGGVRKVSGRSGFLVNSIIVVSPKVYARVRQAGRAAEAREGRHRQVFPDGEGP